MIEKGKTLLPEATAKALLVSQETWGKMRTVFELLDVDFDPEMFEIKNAGGRRRVRVRDMGGEAARGGDGGGSVSRPLELLGGRPAYCNEPTGSPPASSKDIWVRFGLINHVRASNWQDSFRVSTSGDVHFWAEVTVGQAERLEVTSWIIKEGATLPGVSGTWPVANKRPTTINVMLGSVLSGVIETDGGNVMLADYISSANFSAGNWQMGRGVSQIRGGGA